jgi:hypothetical protein
MAISSLPITPLDDLRWLGFYLLDEFLVSLFVSSPIQFNGVEVVDEVTALAHHTTAHTSLHAHMERRLLLWRLRSESTFWLVFSILLWKMIITLNM